MTEVSQLLAADRVVRLDFQQTHSFNKQTLIDLLWTDSHFAANRLIEQNIVVAIACYARPHRSLLN